MKSVRIPNVGDEVLYHMNGTVRPGKVVTGGDDQSTYVGLLIMTASDGTPGGLDKCAPTFYAYSPYGEKDGHWQWKDEMNQKEITVQLNDAGQVVAANSVEPVPSTKVEEASAVEEPPDVSNQIPIGVQGVMSPESNLGKVVDLQIQTIKAAVSKVMMMTKNGRLTVSGSAADVEQFQTMIEAIGKSQEELRTILFGS